MPKLTLWREQRGNDWNFIDNASREIIEIGGVGIIVHRYLGPSSGGGATTIEDVVFMENRSRSYDTTLFELKGHYLPENSDFNLTQFGLFLSNDYIFVEFHINDMVERLGRKLMSGDVLEFVNLREYFSLDDSLPGYNKFFVVEDAFRSSTGFGPDWWPHIWRVKAKTLVDSEEYAGILGNKGTTAPPVDNPLESNLSNILSSYNQLTCTTAQVVAEAECEVKYDPTYFEGHQYFIHNDENGVPCVYYGTGDGTPPNGQPLLGQGDDFPSNMQDGQFFLRTDFDPPGLYMKKGCKFIFIEYDHRKPWTGQNRLLDTFIDNKNTTKLNDGTTVPEKQSLSQVVKPRDGQ